ncbi:MAG: carboxypeptidase regulatory-like domain-containing protein [Planctomycetota bacterium]|nr:MAG: carboxypeptidase regulatory-like domain-containing protein [Planctomycetota bacterium]
MSRPFPWLVLGGGALFVALLVCAWLARTPTPTPLPPLHPGGEAIESGLVGVDSPAPGPDAPVAAPLTSEVEPAPGAEPTRTAVTARVVGRVVDPNVRAVEGATVRLWQVRTRDARQAPGPALSTTTDAAGTFVFERASPGASLLRAWRTGFAPSEVWTCELFTDASIDDPVLMLRPSARITGRVVDENAQPEAEREIELRGGGTDALGLPRTARSDVQGRFEFADLAPGRYELVRVRDARDRWSDDAPAERAQVLARLRRAVGIHLAEGQSAEVELGAGKPLEVVVWGTVRGAERETGPLHVEAWTGERTSSRVGDAPLDERGEYTLALERAGRFELQVVGPSGVLLMRSIEVIAGSSQQVDLELGGAELAGSVVDVLGRAVAAAELELGAPGRAMRRATAGADGAFRFGALPAGAYWLSARPPSMATPSVSPVVLEVELREDERIEGFAVRCPLVAALDVCVERDGGALRGARVRVRDASGEAAAGPTPRETDASGRTSVEGLASGAWYVQASFGGALSAWSGPFELAEGSRADARLVVFPPAELRVRLGELFGRATSVVAVDEHGFELARVLTAAEVVLTGLPCCRARIRALAGKEVLRELLVEIDSPRPLPVELAR